MRAGYVKSLAATVVLIVAGSGAASGAEAAESAAPEIKVLSNRADLVSGGDALVEVPPPRGTDAARLKVTLGRRDVTGQFAVRPAAATWRC